jgi:hypothetical protein
VDSDSRGFRISHGMRAAMMGQSTCEDSGCLRNSLTVAVSSCSCTMEVSSVNDSEGRLGKGRNVCASEGRFRV